MSYLRRHIIMALRIDEFISDLLYSTDCVVIPGLGGFVANTRSAFLNPAQHTFSPPSKRIAFNAGLRTNDGLLAHHISNVSDISYTDAVLQIQIFVENAFDILNEGETFRIDKIGSMVFDAEKHLQFEPDTSVNYLSSSFGLTTIHSPAIRREETVGHVRNTKTVKKVNTTVKKSFWRLLELVPAAAILALLAFSPSLIKNLNANLSSIIPLENAAPATIADQTSVTASPSKEIYPETKFDEAPIVDSLQSAIELSDSTTALNVPDIKTEKEADVKEENKAETIEPVPPVSTKVVNNSKAVAEVNAVAGNYYVIGGCFKVYDNAVKFKEAAFEKGFDAQIIGKNAAGLTMVSLFSSKSSAETAKQMSDIKSEFQEDAWMYKKSN